MWLSTLILKHSLSTLISDIFCFLGTVTFIQDVFYLDTYKYLPRYVNVLCRFLPSEKLERNFDTIFKRMLLLLLLLFIIIVVVIIFLLLL